MSVTKQLKKDIAILDAEITALEIKRSRSEAAIIEALVGGEEPTIDDIKYFRKYTAEIEEKRERIVLMQQQFDTVY